MANSIKESDLMDILETNDKDFEKVRKVRNYFQFVLKTFFYKK